MSIDTEEQAVRQGFRITGDPSWRVLKWWRGEWVVAYYCRSEDGAARQLERCVQKALEWSRMTPEERIQAVLRKES